MPGKRKTEKRGIVSRALSAMVGVFSRRRWPAGTSVTATNPQSARRNESGTATAGRGTRRQTDIPMDQIEAAYTPTQTSLKAPFRSSGADRQRDQEFARGADDRWNDEDRLTNKSGDPRIGTHGRTYEPGERRAAAGRSDEE